MLSRPNMMISSNGNIFRVTGPCINIGLSRPNMMTSSNGNIFRVTGPLCGESRVYSPHKGQWRGVLMFSSICAWINGWVNYRKTGDLRRHRTQYDVILMKHPLNTLIIFRCVGVPRGCLSYKNISNTLIFFGVVFKDALCFIVCNL